MSPRQTADMAHVANEWADAATNGLQWLRNVADGTSTAEHAIAEMEGNIAHCKQVSALQAASNAELERLRERVAGLEAALKALVDAADASGDFGYVSDPNEAECAQCSAVAETQAKLVHDARCLVPIIERAQSALSGSTAVLDAVVAEAVAKVTEERDECRTKALDVENHPVVKVLREERDAARLERDQMAAALDRMATEFQRCVDEYATAFHMQMASVRESFEDGTATIVARDARVRAEGAAIELSDAADEMEARRLQDIDFTASDLRARAAELRKLAAQAGEVANEGN